MRITVLAVPDCPHVSLARERIVAALDGRAAEIDLVEVTDEEQATALGMTGSPTILIDGRDPFAEPGAAPSMSCRLYRRPDGRAEGAPVTAQLRRALQAADAADDCGCPPLDAVGRAGRGRLAPLTGGLRAVQQATLRHFATTGRPPASEDLTAAARPFGRTVTAILAELAAEDFLTLDADSQIRAAYPFSAVPTPHQVRFRDGTTAWSMCAIDALGIPAMLDTDAEITSTDPVTGEPVTITFTDGHTTWQPHSAVVYVGQLTRSGPAAEVTCSALNFFTSRTSAHAWAEQHPEYTGRTLNQTRAERMGKTTFQPLLAGTDQAPTAALPSECGSTIPLP